MVYYIQMDMLDQIELYYKYMFESWFNYLNPQQLVDMQNFKKFLLENWQVSSRK